jgi:hypothetical protein
MSAGKCFAMLWSVALLTAMLASPAGAHSPGNGRGYFGAGPGSDPRPVTSLAPQSLSAAGLIGKPAYSRTPYNPWQPRIWVVGPHGRRIP